MENRKDYFSLKWSDFKSSFSEGFHDFLQEEAMVDVTLAVEGKFVQAHKLVLSVCSPYFKNLFKVNPCTHPIVILKDVGHSDLSYMLDFMYKGEVGVKHEDLPSFLKLAEILKIKGLAGKKIEKNENFPPKNLDSNLARVRKKSNKETTSDVRKETDDIQLCNEESGKKLFKSRKRRLSCKTKSTKKLKSEKCEDGSVSNCVTKNSDSLSEDEDNNPLIMFIGDHSVKSGENSKQGEYQCDNENDSQCDNKTSFSGWSDGVPDSDDSRGPDINSLFQSDYFEATEETPQGGVDYQMIQTKRGRDMLLFGGYTFTQNRMCKDGMRWQCSYPKCKAFCRMSSAGWLTPYKTQHDHPKPSEQEIKKRILRMELKARAQSSGATPGEILRNALPAEEFHSTDRACFTRCIQRFRKSLQRKNFKPQEEVWQTSTESLQPEKDSVNHQISTNGEPSWVTEPRSHMAVPDPGKVDDWHSHQDSDTGDKETQLLSGKNIIQGKIEPYGM